MDNIELLVYDEDKINDLVVEIGKNIRDERLSRNWSTKKFADKANVTDGFIYKMESGAKNIGLTSFLKAQIALGVEPNQLIPILSEEYKLDPVNTFAKMINGLDKDSVNYLLNMVEMYVKFKK